MDEYCAFYGCVIPNRYPGIEASIRKTLPALGIKLVDAPDFSCCPAPGIFQSFNYKAWITLAARNIAVAEERGLKILTFCNGCFGSLYDANAALKADKKLLQEVNISLGKIGKKVSGEEKVEHIALLLYNKIGIDKIKQVVKKPLGLNVATHSGCHLLRSDPYKEVDNNEKPRILDELVEALGCKSVKYDSKVQCCGAGGGVRTALAQISLQILHEKVKPLNSSVDCLTDLCPFCHLQLDKGQVELNSQYGLDYKFPVLYYMQLLGLAMGLTAQELGITANFTQTDSVLKKINELQVVTPQIAPQSPKN